MIWKFFAQFSDSTRLYSDQTMATCKSRFFVGFSLPCNLFGLLILWQSVSFYCFFNCPLHTHSTKREFLENWARAEQLFMRFWRVERLDFIRADPIASRKWAWTFTPLVDLNNIRIVFQSLERVSSPDVSFPVGFYSLLWPGLGVCQCQLLRVKFAYSYSPL